MSMSISIHPTSDSLDMYGEPDATSAYSVSGVVRISVTSPYSIFERRRTARLLLQSISLTFEGQSEIYTPTTGYSSLRLCTVTRELAPCEPTELSNEGQEEEETPCQWNVVFNLPVSGWLPATTTLGMDDIGIRYGLYATARFVNLDVEQTPSWGFASLCAPFRTRVRSAYASKTITLRRFVLHPHVDRLTSTPINYLVNSHASSVKADMDKKRIPAEVLSKIQVLASVPDCVDMEENSFPITLRLRTKDLDDAECKRLQVTDVGIDVIQQEKCRYRPSAAFLAHYPLPPREMQPPNVPLRDPHPICAVYDVGLYISKELSESVCRTFSLLPADENGKYKLANDNYAFASDAEQGENPTWYTMETRVPVSQVSPATVDSQSAEWAGPAVIRPTSSSPLFSVSHDVSISLTFTYDVPGCSEKARERLNFNIPVTFGQYLPPSPPSHTLSPLLDLNATSSVVYAPIDSPSESSSPDNSFSYLNLPAYSQLYDSNGDRKIDYSTPLPLYTPKKEETSPDYELETSTSLCDNEKPATHLLIDSESANLSI